MAAGASGNLDSEPDTVLIVIDQQFANPLYQAAGRAFVPQRFAAATEIVRFTGANGVLERFGIHIAVHQQFTAIGIGRHSRDQAVDIEFGRKLRAFLDLLDAHSRRKQIPPLLIPLSSLAVAIISRVGRTRRGRDALRWL